MKSFFLNLITFAISLTTVYFMDYHFGWELKGSFSGLIAALLTQIILINLKLDDILESRKTDDYHGGVGIK